MTVTDLYDALSIWDSTMVNNSMSAPALLACKARTKDAEL